MEPGLVLPTSGPGAGRPSLEAAVAIVNELGWGSVWVTDHILVGRGDEEDEYGTILEAIVSLAYVAALAPEVTIGTSVVIPPLRNPVLLAKELATLDELSGGRLVAGVGVANRRDVVEFRNLGVEDRLAVRGRWVDESIVLWRHLWAGKEPPFIGEFHHLEDYVFRPLPPQGEQLPIWTGGRSERALHRAAQIADGYHAARTSPDDLAGRLPVLRRLSEEAGRPLPTLSIRTRAHFDIRRTDVYTLSGSVAEMRRDVEAFASLGVEVLAVTLDESHPDRIRAAAERLQVEVFSPVLD